MEMSRKLAMDNISLTSNDGFAHTEYSLDYHETLKKKFNVGSLNNAFDLDFLFYVNHGPIDWAKNGRVTDMGHAVYAENGSDERQAAVCPFNDIEEVLEFDPVKEYGLLDFNETVKFYEQAYQRQQANNPEQLVPGGYYRSLISGAIETFGWDMLLLAASEPEKFAAVLRRFGKYSLHQAKAWAETSIEAYIQHDDMVWTSGPFISPEFYRGVIFPIYKELWKPLKKAGKKILFCSDGTFDMFLEDLAECGADGFIFEPTNNLDYAVERFGKTHCLVGSKCDCRTMTFGTWENVKAEMDATFELSKKCKGFIWSVGNHIPANVSDEICLKYLEYLRILRKKTT